jgi:hypothetical protein
VTLGNRTARVDRRGRLRLRLACPAAEVLGCRGTLALRFSRVLARRSFSIAGGAATSVGIRLDARARRLLARKRRLRIVAEVVATDAAGNRGVTRRSVTLLRR